MESKHQKLLDKLLEAGDQATYEETMERLRKRGRKPTGLRQLEERQREYDAVEDLLDSMDVD